jgi:glycosyltransferase involved in cell wall biosynthesis
MTVSLVISTYNWKEALYLSLQSVKYQTRIPDEVIVADDGSRADTRHMVDAMSEHFPCPLHHVWHHDEGWRKCAIMNRAFARCTGDYIIQIDGDIIMHSHFIEDHLKEARPKTFLVGSRSKLRPKLTQRLLMSREFSLHFYTVGLSRRLNALRLTWIAKVFHRYKQEKKERGCNMSFWRSDLYAVNGYDERFVGYGFEDIDLPMRLRRNGVAKRFVKFKAIEYHLHHSAAATKRDMSANEAIYNENNGTALVRCPLGIDQYLKK